MNNINAIIVDDELHARNVIEKLIDRSDYEVTICGSFSRLLDAVEFIKHNKLDVVFLDIQMPQHSGYEIVNFFDKIDFEIVFVTAYDNYAINAFDLSAIDYLVKPVNRARFYNTLERLSKKLELKNNKEDYELLLQNFKSKNKKIVIPEIDQKRIIDTQKIICIQGQGSYSKIYFIDGTSIIVSKNLKAISLLIQGDSKFFRSQRSWLINIDFVRGYNVNKQSIEMENKIIVRLSSSKADEFVSRFNKYFTKS